MCCQQTNGFTQKITVYFALFTTANTSEKTPSGIGVHQKSPNSERCESSFKVNISVAAPKDKPAKMPNKMVAFIVSLCELLKFC